MKPVIILNNISVRYRAPEEVIRTFKEYAIQVLKRNVRYREFMALDQVDLEVHDGEILGILRRNGAGKSTLLKVISRVLIPTEGRVRIRGIGHEFPDKGLLESWHPVAVSGCLPLALRKTFLPDPE